LLLIFDDTKILEKLQTKSISIENCFNFIEENLIIRVESLKVDLDKLAIKLCKKIDTFQHVSVKTQKEKLLNSKTCLVNLEKISQMNLNEKLNLIKLNILKLKEVESLSENIITPTKKMTGKNSTKKNSLEIENALGTREMIGYLYGPFSIVNASIRNSQNFSVKLVDLSKYLKSACGLAEIYNNARYSLALTDFANSSLNMFENCDSFMGKETNLTRLTKIKDIKFKNYYAICTNNSSYLYVCDMELHRILIFDLKSFKLKRILSGLGPNGEQSRRLEFNCPRDICFFDKKVYVLDQGANSIDIFSESGDFVRSFLFNEDSQIKVENAWSVRVAENVMVIVDWKQRLFIFDFSGQLKETIECLDVVSVCFTGSSEYLYVHCENGDFLCFKLLNNEFQIKPSLIYRKNFTNLKYRSEFMIHGSNQKFILSLGWRKALALIEL